MYAIVNIGGFQYKVEKDLRLKVPRMKLESGLSVEFEEVLFISDGANIEIGRPFVEEAKVSAEVLQHGKHKKVLVFKKKRRKGYRRKRGHRQLYTEIRVTGIRTIEDIQETDADVQESAMDVQETVTNAQEMDTDTQAVVSDAQEAEVDVQAAVTDAQETDTDSQKVDKDSKNEN